MRVLIVEDDLASRKYIYKLLSAYGECDITIDGLEALDAFLLALDDGQAYDLICLDIMMPKFDGIKVLKAIRDIENQRNIEEDKKVKIIMITALNEIDVVQKSFDSGCEAYAAKPINKEKFIQVLKKLNLIN